MLSWLTGALNFITAPLTTVVDNWQKRQTARVESEIKIKEAVTNAKITQLATQQAADIAWENTALQTSGWKSGYLTLLLSVPMILCFIPGGDAYVVAGFTSLKDVPEWYQYAIGVMIGADFGYRKIIDFMATKKGI